MRRLEPPDEVLGELGALLESVHAWRPAVFDAGLLGPQLASLGCSWSALCEAAEPWIISTQPNYRDYLFEALAEHLRTGSPSSRARFGAMPNTEIAIRDYVEQIQAEPERTEPAVELRPSPALLDRLAGPSPLFDTLGLSRLHPGKTDAADAIVVYAYVAAAGHSSDLHFDRDGRHVFNVQLTGRKRFVLFSPTSGPVLNPIMQFGGLRAREWSARQRHDFLAYAGGCEVVLEPGQGLYMPPFCWHHIDYLDAAAGLGYRIRPPDPGLQRVLARIPANYMLQTLAAELLVRDDEPAQRCRTELEAFIERPVRSARAEYEAARPLLRACLARLGVDLFGGGSPVLDSIDFGAPLFSQFLCKHLAPEQGPSLALASDLQFAPLGGDYVALVRGSHSVTIPLALGQALLANPRFDLEVLITEHPEIASRVWTRVITKLVELGLVEGLSACEPER